MNRTLNLLYILLFSALLLALSLWSLRGVLGFSVSSETSVLDGKLAQAFEKRYDDQFPIKQLGTNLWALLDYKLFGEGRQGVVIGQDGWLFSDEEFDPVAEGNRHVRDNLALIGGVRDELAKHNVELMLAIIPAKSRLYPEYVGETTPTALRQDLYERFRGVARKAGILAPDLLATLEQAKDNGQVFLRTDTHWTPLGAEAVAGSLGKAVGEAMSLRGNPQPYVTDIQGVDTYKGDLTRFLPLDPLFENLMPAPDQLQKRSTRSQNEGAAADDALFAESDVPVVLVGTSYSANDKWNFAGALRQALQRDLVNHAEDGHGPILPMLKYLKSDELKDAPPQLVIWEFPERYLPMLSDLSDFDPEWIASLRKGAGTDERLASRSGK
ncbi:alginate O-acetyltransferase [Pseudomonas sp. JM0905a]|uniref:Probable alginate O-acetylase AlgJ n=1 Tax=Metapseudomonas resinovorans TaxID=53412 RepID=A0ABT4Y7Q4_METRE|nr:MULTISPECIES: alginate O-acetyltransferase [Pseudomonas]MBD2835985.1 alginate O-acetyltransferase [Pseudomonas sp. JM0905a]MDA8484796.1 alginate O-acetyltransferase [Pseudomonas resinovorans]